MDPQELLKPTGVAHVLGIGRTKVYAMLASREIRSIRIGRSLRVPRQEIARWIEQQLDAAHARSLVRHAGATRIVAPPRPSPPRTSRQQTD